MKYFIALCGAVALLAAAPPKPPNAITVTVNGEASISRAPDLATVSLGIQTNAESAAAASQDNNARYEDMRTKLHAIGVTDGQIRTLSYNVNYVPPPAPQPQPEAASRPVYYPYYGPHPGYNVTRELQIALTDLNLVGNVIDQALLARVTNVNGVGYTNSQERTLYAAALKMAIQDAQRQARAMAEASNLRILRLSSLQTGYYAQPMIMRSMSAAPAAQAGIPTQITPGALDVRANVTATYVLAP